MSGNYLACPSCERSLGSGNGANWQCENIECDQYMVQKSAEMTETQLIETLPGSPTKITTQEY